MDLKNIKIETQKEIKNAKNIKALDEIFRKYLGKKGEITQIFDSLKKLSEEKKRKIGRQANLLKNEFKEEIKKKLEKIKKEERELKLKKEKIDISRPGKKIESGHLHPLTLIQREIEEIFNSMGFEIAEGPEIESEWYNFDGLNFPPDHPAREMQDTFFLKQKNREKLPPSKKFVLRTHTSPVQIRYMEKHQPPLRIIVPGRVFRHEATDAGHESNFYHLEGLMVGKDISVANFKAIIEEFLRRLFKTDLEIRLRPSYFPFVEPGFEIDMTCLICKGKGCFLCSKTGWLELMGAGMVHPNVFKNSGLIPHQLNNEGWQGFAFGIGLDRLSMMKYKINDIRLFYSGNLRFLKQI